MRCRRLLLTMLAVGVASVNPKAGPAASPKFALEMDGGIVIPVRLNGAGPFRFRLDTGASRSVISDQLARRLALPAAGASRLVTPTGSSRARLVAIDALDIGCPGPSAVSALVLPEAALDDSRRVDGLVGQDLLSTRVYTIDYQRRELGCHGDRGSRARGVRLPLVIENGRALVSVPVASGGALRLVPDSGADRLVLFGGGSGGPLLTPLEFVTLRSVTGVRQARRVLVHGLGLGGPSGRHYEGLLIENSTDEAWMGDGLLPLHLFARATMDGPGREVVLEGWR